MSPLSLTGGLACTALALTALTLTHCGTLPTEMPETKITVVGGDPANGDWDTMTVEANGLSKFEGIPIKVLVGGVPVGTQDRMGFGSAKVGRGSFRMVFPDVKEAGMYKGLSLYYDLDNDGQCTPGTDQGFSRTLEAGVRQVGVAKDDYAPMTFDNCAVFPKIWPE